jgi:SAM-dependent methyltransferase
MTGFDEHLHLNRSAWDRLSDGSQFAKIATDEECREPLKTLDGRGWLPKTVANLEVLCLASGGGWQSVLYATAGARVTVVDLSDGMLALDRREAERRNLSIRTVQASMDDLSMLNDAAYDIVHQPVSTCYVPNLAKVYAEIARVCRDGGVYISQHKQPTSAQITHRDRNNHFVVGIEYYHQGPLPRIEDKSYRERGAVEYLHRWDELIGELCRAGFVIEDLREPNRSDAKAPVEHFGYRGRFVPPYVRLKARRLNRQAQPGDGKSQLWIPS